MTPAEEALILEAVARVLGAIGPQAEVALINELRKLFGGGAWTPKLAQDAGEVFAASEEKMLEQAGKTEP